MAEPGDKSNIPSQDASRAGGQPRLRDLWQAPTLIVGAGLLIAGLAAALSARPQFDLAAALDRAESLVGAGHAEEALAQLNGEVLSHLDEPATTPVQRRHFHLLLADALHTAQRQQGLEHPENNQRIVEEYERVEAMGQELDPERIERTAGALIGLHRHVDAMRRIETLPDAQGPRRIAMRKKAIESMLESVHIEPGHPTPERELQETLEALAALTGDRAATDHDRVWAVARQAELRIRSGHSEAAIDHLLPSLHRLDELHGHEAGELFGLLGSAYFNLGQVAEAEKHLLRAETMLESGSDARGEAQLLLARCSAMRGDREEARERFAAAVADFGSSRLAPEALLGLAESEAAIGSYERALDAYTALLDNLEDGGHASAEFLEEIDASLRDRTEDRTGANETELALRFAALGERLHSKDKTPAWALLAMAENNRTIGERLYATVVNPAGEVLWEHVDPVTRAEIRRAFGQAASRFREHGRTMIGVDEEAYGRSLWAAGECFDRAGDLDMAITTFAEYASGRPNDSRRFGARFRLAQSHQARGDFVIAADLYRSLIQDDPSSGERFKSIVPLVQCLLADQDPLNDADAERMLVSMLSGGMSPEAPDFRLALNELGAFYYRAARYPQAIERLTESLERFPGANDAPMIRYMLADALRLSAAQIGGSLAQAMPQAQRQELLTLKEQRLEQALALYQQICESSAERDLRRMSELDRIALRNAYFYRADCAFDLGGYEQAIDYYDAAANRYSDDAASLVAMIQIVNAYTKMGQWAEAATANERARQRFRELPESAFERADLPLERRHWERWLDSTTELAAQSENGAEEAH